MLLVEQNNFILTDKQRKFLNRKYLHKEDEIDYIFYNGNGCNDDNKHSLEEIMEMAEEDDFINFDELWPCIIVLFGAGVVWKKL